MLDSIKYKFEYVIYVQKYNMCYEYTALEIRMYYSLYFEKVQYVERPRTSISINLRHKYWATWNRLIGGISCVT